MERVEQNNNLTLLPTGNIRHSRLEICQIIEKVGELRSKGYSFQQIANLLRISKSQAYRHFCNFVEQRKKEWLKTRWQAIIVLNITYERRLAEAERHCYEAQRQGNARSLVFWHKLSLETLDSYADFLTKIGFITKHTFTELERKKKVEQKTPIQLLIDSYQENLRERILNNAHNENENKSSQGDQKV